MVRVPIAGLLSWIVPGLGHLFLGDRGRGIVLLVTITATFWSGVAIGGVTSTVDAKEHTLWFAAQLCTGGNTGAAYLLGQSVRADLLEVRGKKQKPLPAHWISAEVGVHYTGVAGLLNLLVILDAMVRAERPIRRTRAGPSQGVP